MNRRWYQRRPFVQVVASLVVLVGIAGALAAWATTYDRRTSDRLMPGTVIEGVSVGGMRAKDAVRLLRKELEDPLHRPVTVRAGSVERVTSPWELGLRVDVAAAVRRAQGAVSGNALARVWNRLFTSHQQRVSATPRWQPDVLDARLAEVGADARVEPKGPAIDSSTGWVRTTPGKPGLEVDANRSRDAVTDGITLGDPVIKLPTRDIAPAADANEHVILVRAGENKLYLYKNWAIVNEWPVATGASGYATPTGQWKVIEKLVNPSWYNPGSAWARGMPARIGPGPNNPLGSHALALDAPAILIHATPDRSSIGYSVSHGCIRMLTEHEIELFNQVTVGTPVVVVNAGEPQARTTPPVTTSPDLSVAANF